VNGLDCGMAWAPPYRVQITNALRSGTNKIEIIVYNTAANALARRPADCAACCGERSPLRPPIPDAGLGPRHGVRAVRAATRTDDRAE
jgi:hypothetical protein